MNAISAAIIGVPDQILSPYCLDNFVPGVRRALPAIEQGLSGPVEWDLFADLSVETRLEHTLKVYGKRFTSPQRSLFS